MAQAKAKAAPVEKESKISAPSKAKAAPAEAEVEAEAEPKAAKNRSKFPNEHIITLLVDHNPKRPSSESHARFEHYEDEMTVEAALAAGITTGDLNWDVAHDFIKIGEEFDADAEKKAKAPPKPRKAKAEKEGEEETPAEEEPEEAPAPKKPTGKKK
jgi:hypothetical protein